MLDFLIDIGRNNRLVILSSMGVEGICPRLFHWINGDSEENCKGNKVKTLCQNMPFKGWGMMREVFLINKFFIRFRNEYS